MPVSELFPMINMGLGGVDWMLTSEVVIAGIVIVMLVLILLILIFQAFGKVAGGKKANKQEAESIAVICGAVGPAVCAPSQAAPAPAPVQAGVSAEIVAAISAAVYAYQGGSNFVIRSIKVRNVSGRTPWAAAAVRDNTRPF